MQFRGGCGKGANSFSTYQKCMEKCSYNQGAAALPTSGQNLQNEQPLMGIPGVPSQVGPPKPPAQPSIPVQPGQPSTPGLGLSNQPGESGLPFQSAGSGVPGHPRPAGAPGSTSSTFPPSMSMQSGPSSTPDIGLPNQPALSGQPAQSAGSGLPGQASSAGAPGHASSTLPPNPPAQSASFQKSSKVAKKQPPFCTKPPFLGSCRPLAQTWYYSSTEKRCTQLGVGFCNGGSNKFLSENKCKDTCQSPTKAMPYMCLKPPVRVSCGKVEQAWFFDPNTTTCKIFTYTASSCENVRNKFRTESMCQAVCSRGQATATSPTSKQHPNELPSGGKPSVPGQSGQNVNPGQPAVTVSPNKTAEPSKPGQMSPVGPPGQPAPAGPPSKSGPSQVPGPTSPVGPAAQPSTTTLPIQPGLPQKPGQMHPGPSVLPSRSPASNQNGLPQAHGQVGPNSLPAQTTPLGPPIQSGLPQKQGLSRLGPAGRSTMFTSHVPAGLPSKPTDVNQAGPSGGPALPGRRI
ncbi:uncharacterized protein LOC142587951 isoform X1 [Dermacentor variabilis]|uniref:uncharacterized protein LOC142587951 isoform X1 n=1 Tax=Dermacentor variabilis TaxID=34621 RepID=UPI003F5BAA7B